MHTHSLTAAALYGLALLQLLMLLALMAALSPHPPAYTTPFAMGPFLASSITLSVVAALLESRKGLLAPMLAMVAAGLALLSYGPHKWFDAQIAQIWPAVLLGQLGAVVVWSDGIARLRRELAMRSTTDRVAA